MVEYEAYIAALREQQAQALNDALEIVKIGRAPRYYPGAGGIWFKEENGPADANFEDWGLARAVAEIINAVREGRLVKA